MNRHESIHFFASIGCKFVALNGKVAADPHWQRQQLSADEIAVWRGNIGVLCGQYSGGICWLDVDYDAMTFLQRYGIFFTFADRRQKKQQPSLQNCGTPGRYDEPLCAIW